MAAPTGTNQFELGDNMPTEEELLERGWTKVNISVPEERYITKGRNVGCRRQYSMRHQGSATINKLMVSMLPVSINCELDRLILAPSGKHAFAPKCNRGLSDNTVTNTTRS